MALRARPLYDRIIVRCDTEDPMTDGGIFIPGKEGKRKPSAEVVAVGPGPRNRKGETIPMTLKVGDRVLLGRNQGVEITLEGESYQIMREGDIAGILDAEATVEGVGPGSKRHNAHAHYLDG